MSSDVETILAASSDSDEDVNLDNVDLEKILREEDGIAHLEGLCKGTHRDNEMDPDIPTIVR